MKEKKYVTRVFAWGACDAGQLGVISEEGESTVPVEVSYLNDKRIKEVACGGMHTLALSIDGTVYSWGCNDEGVLGRGGNEEEPAPVIFPTSVFIKKIVAGDSISGGVDEFDNLWTWGLFRGPSGVIGHSISNGGKVLALSPTPTIVPRLKVMSVEAGCNHLAAVDLQGRLYTWGDGGNCQLGRVISKRVKTSESLRPCLAMNNVDAAAVGAYHTMAVRRRKDPKARSRVADKQSLYTEGAFFNDGSSEVYIYDQNRPNTREEAQPKKSNKKSPYLLSSHSRKKKAIVEAKSMFIKQQEFRETLSSFPPAEKIIRLNFRGEITRVPSDREVHLPCTKTYPSSTPAGNENQLKDKEDLTTHKKDETETSSSDVVTYLAYAEEIKSDKSTKADKSTEADETTKHSKDGNTVPPNNYVVLDEVQRMVLFDRRRKMFRQREESKRVKMSSCGVNNFGQSPFSSLSDSSACGLWGKWSQCSKQAGPSTFRKGMGGEHSTHILDAHGTLWGVGRNTFGQLGIGDSVNRDAFTRCLVSDVDDFSVTSSHTLALSHGKVFSWGFGDSGRLGYSADVQVSPREVQLNGVAISVGAGGQHSAAVVAIDSTDGDGSEPCIFGMKYTGLES